LEFISSKVKSSHIWHSVASTVLGSFFHMAQQPLVGKGLFMIEVSREHSGTPYSLRLLRTGDQPPSEASLDKTQHSQERNILAACGTRIRNSSSERTQTHATGFGPEVASK